MKDDAFKCSDETISMNDIDKLIYLIKSVIVDTISPSICINGLFKLGAPEKIISTSSLLAIMRHTILDAEN